MQALIKVERALTEALEEAEPWLMSTSTTSSVRPLPQSLEQAEQVLATARNLSSRTSAPAGWNPQAPVIGFATPNPLPHQLRGGALGTLQLQRARDGKRKRLEAEKQAQVAAIKQEVKEVAEAMEIVEDEIVEEIKESRDAKRKEVVTYERALDLRSQSDISKSIHQSQREQPPQQQVLTADMNLSDSSSDESD